jgi:hypothetical protein
VPPTAAQEVALRQVSVPSSLSSITSLSLNLSNSLYCSISLCPRRTSSNAFNHTFPRRVVSFPVLSCPVLSCHIYFPIVCPMMASNSSFTCSSSLLFSISLQVLLTGCCDSVARRAPLGSVKSGSRHRRLTGNSFSSCLFPLHSPGA